MIHYSIIYYLDIFEDYLLHEEFNDLVCSIFTETFYLSFIILLLLFHFQSLFYIRSIYYHLFSNSSSLEINNVRRFIYFIITVLAWQRIINCFGNNNNNNKIVLLDIINKLLNKIVILDRIHLINKNCCNLYTHVYLFINLY